MILCTQKEGKCIRRREIALIFTSLILQYPFGFGYEIKMKLLICLLGTMAYFTHSPVKRPLPLAWAAGEISQTPFPGGHPRSPLAQRPIAPRSPTAVFQVMFLQSHMPFKNSVSHFTTCKFSPLFYRLMPLLRQSGAILFTCTKNFPAA